MFADRIKKAFKLNYREGWAVDQIVSNFRNLLTGKRVIASLVIIGEMFGMLFSLLPVSPNGQKLDLTGYNQVFCDEFDGTALNMDIWNYRCSGSRRMGFNSSSQVKVENGNLVITGEYLENGEYGAGWYAGMINLKQYYKNGYFEIKCICNKGTGFWSAFWLQSGNSYTPAASKGGIGGAEVDIFESSTADGFAEKFRTCVTQNIHCCGAYDETDKNLNSRQLGFFKGKNITEEYNTYGLEWTQDEYIFYINGVETTRSSFANGVSEVPEEVIVSLEIPGEMNHDTDHSTQFIVDYVKIYQKP